MKTGYDNEFKFINSLNNKEYQQLNPLFQDMLKILYPDINSKSIIKAYKYGRIL